jgi:protein-tyrosine-phosphatase/DNA-binding transcriptional ArsR family regulator
MSIALPTSGPPPLLALAGDELRWVLLRELAGSDRRVGELTAASGRPQNLVSYHLGKLRSGGLVTSRRSSADGRDTYYSLDLARCAALLSEAGAALHPGLRPNQQQEAVGAGLRGRVLFLCTGNSARSQMAEALLARWAPRIDVVSAGSHPKQLHPNAVAVMREYGIDLSGRRAKHLDEFAGQPFNYVISLCDRVREVCPQFPDDPSLVHWSMPDPSASGDTHTATCPAFRHAAEHLSTRIRFFLRAMSETDRRKAFQHE